MKAFLVMCINKEQTVKINNCTPELKERVKISWANGMIGAIPVFKKREDAEKYADGKEVVELDY